MGSSTDRMRKLRRLLRLGLRPLSPDAAVDDVDVPAWLVKVGALDASEIDNWSAVSKAAGEFLNRLAKDGHVEFL